MSIPAFGIRWGLGGCSHSKAGLQLPHALRGLNMLAETLGSGLHGPQWQEFLLRYRCLTLLAPGSSDRGLGYEKVSLIVWVMSHELQMKSHCTGTVFVFFSLAIGWGVLAEAVNCYQAPLFRSCWSGQQKSWLCPDCDLDQGDPWLGWVRSEFNGWFKPFKPPWVIRAPQIWGVWHRFNIFLTGNGARNSFVVWRVTMKRELSACWGLEYLIIGCLIQLSIFSGSLDCQSDGAWVYAVGPVTNFPGAAFLACFGMTPEAPIWDTWRQGAWS